MAGDSVHLQFTQEDRDLLMGINQKLNTLVERHGRQDRRLSRHNSRIKRLESLRDQGKGAANVLRLLWVALAALAGLLGYHVTKH